MTLRPGERQGTLVLVAPVHPQGRRWLVKWDCCGDEQELTREAIQRLARKAERGLHPCCRRCAKEQALIRAHRRRKQPPPTFAPRAPITKRRLPEGVIGPEAIWPRPPSLAGRPPRPWADPR